LSVGHEYEWVDVVFVGTITSEPELADPSPANRYYLVSFKANKMWKGELVNNEADVFLSDARFSGFEKGQIYLVFAKRDSHKPHIFHGSRTRRIAEAQEDLEALANKEAGIQAGRILGRIAGLQRVLPAQVRSPDGSLQRKTVSEDGTFQFSGLMKGIHEIRLDFPEELDPDPLIKKVKLINDWDVIRISDTFMPGGRIEGRVLDAAGVPASGFPVVAISASDYRKTKADDNGGFAIRHLPAGRYLLVPEIEESYASQLFDRIRSEDLRADLFRIEPGDVFQLPDLTLPVTLEIKQLEGILCYPSGNLAAGIEVRLVGAPAGATSVMTDERGYFSFEIYANLSYRLWSDSFGKYENGTRILRAELEIPAGFESQGPVLLQLEDRNP
jgi:hypothetical protein